MHKYRLFVWMEDVQRWKVQHGITESVKPISTGDTIQVLAASPFLAGPAKVERVQLAVFHRGQQVIGLYCKYINHDHTG